MDIEDYDDMEDSIIFTQEHLKTQKKVYPFSNFCHMEDV